MKPIKVFGYIEDSVTGENEPFEEAGFLIAPGIALVPENHGTLYFINVKPGATEDVYDDDGILCDITIHPNRGVNAEITDIPHEAALIFAKWAAGL